MQQGQPRIAEQAISPAFALAEKSRYRKTRFAVALATARVRAANGQAAEALRRLRALLNEATHAGFVPVQFETRLALGELELQTGQTAAGRARLAGLVAEAASKGFGGNARQAAKH